MDRDKVLEEIERRVKAEQSQRGEFDRVHAYPASTADVPDEREARLVILRPLAEHAAKDQHSPARQEAAKFLDERGNSHRTQKNTLVFLAADHNRLAELEQAVRQFLAWKSIDKERVILNLDPFQTDQARRKRAEAEETIKQRIPETYCWLLAPGQELKDLQLLPLEWQEYRLQGQEYLAVRAGKKLRNEGVLLPQWSGTGLRLELDRVPLWQGIHIALKELQEDFAQYLYLPRLKDPEVLLAAAREGPPRSPGRTRSLPMPRVGTRSDSATGVCAPGSKGRSCQLACSSSRRWLPRSLPLTKPPASQPKPLKQPLPLLRRPKRMLVVSPTGLQARGRERFEEWQKVE